MLSLRLSEVLTLGFSVLGSVAIVLLLGILMGASQGLLIGYARLNPFSRYAKEIASVNTWAFTCS